VANAIPGAPFVLYLSFYDEVSGSLADPSAITLDITYGTEVGLVPDAAGPFTYTGASSYSSSQVWRIAAGQYAFAWNIPSTALPGVYVANWACTYGGNTYLGTENFPVLAGGPGIAVPGGDTGYWTGSIAYTPSAGTPASPASISFGQVDASGITWLWQKLEGWDGPDVQGGGVIPRSGDQGAWASPQYFAARTLTWTVTASAPSQALRDLARELLSAAVPVSDLATLTVSEPVPKLAYVRRSGKITESYPTLADVTFVVGLVAPDPRKYGTQVYSQSANALPSGGTGFTSPFTPPFTVPAQAPGGSMAVSNNGNFETRPLITVTGPVTGPGLVNVTTGQTVSWSGLTVPAGSQLAVDFGARQALLDGGYAPADAFSSWWTLPPGTSTIQFTGDSDAGASFICQWSDAFL
jgi:Siphovirus-type tail component, C-terminal domain